MVSPFSAELLALTRNVTIGDLLPVTLENELLKLVMHDDDDDDVMVRFRERESRGESMVSWCCDVVSLSGRG